MLLGHSANGGGLRHALADHLRGAARLAGEFAEAFGARELGEYLGLVHDVGKGSCEWQDGLAQAEKRGGRVGVPHKHAGTWLADQQRLSLFAGVVFGHHGGLPDRTGLKAALAEANGVHWAAVQEAIAAVGAAVPEIRPAVPPKLPAWFAEAMSHDPYVADVLVRMVFSAVVDADFLDTEQHFEQAARRRHPLTAAEFVERYEAGREKLLAQAVPAPVDKIRDQVYEQAVAAASGPIGIYRFAAPTGAGKTLANAGFALHHARAHSLRRVILAVPYLSITEQNADVYRRLLDRPGQSVVLEHHSGVDLDIKGRGQWQRLASENWDAPFVVTTTVRLFESLFDRRPSAMRRLHRLANSVIVLDEVQALPDHLLVPIMSMLRTLSERFGVTVLFSSATQPAFERLSPLANFEIRDVIAEPRRLYRDLARVRYEWPGTPRPTLAQVADRIADERQVLAIVNTTATARDLYELVDSKCDEPSVFHLSTRMAAQHRRDVLKRIRALVKAGEPIKAVSTQLVEAGVDLDFPAVYRAYATADAFQQAAGRANRGGNLPFGRLVIFDPVEGSRAERVYGAAVGATRTHFGEDKAQPDDLDALAAYYVDRFTAKNVERDGRDIQDPRRTCDFVEVAERFKMINEETVSVVVPYGSDEQREEVQQVMAILRSGTPKVGGLIRRLRPYLATLPKGIARRAAEDGLTEPIIGDLVEWLGDYDAKRGIVFSDTKEYVF